MKGNYGKLYGKERKGRERRKIKKRRECRMENE